MFRWAQHTTGKDLALVADSAKECKRWFDNVTAVLTAAPPAASTKRGSIFQ